MDEGVRITITNPGENDSEFEKQRELVEWYFGDAIDEIALRHPVRRTDLVTALATTQVSGQLLKSRGEFESSSVIHTSDLEKIISLERDLWRVMMDWELLSHRQIRASHDVHLSIVETLGLESELGSGGPFVLVTGSPD